MLCNNIRQKLHNYIDKGDEKLLKLLYALAKDYSNDDSADYEFSEDFFYTFFSFLSPLQLLNFGLRK